MTHGINPRMGSPKKGPLSKGASTESALRICLRVPQGGVGRHWGWRRGGFLPPRRLPMSPATWRNDGITQPARVMALLRADSPEARLHWVIC